MALALVPGRTACEVVSGFRDPGVMDDALANLNAASAIGNEPTWDCPLIVAQALEWSPGAHRVMVILTDEAGQSYSDPATTQADVAAGLVALGVRFHALCEAADVADYARIAAATGGSVLSIESDDVGGVMEREACGL